MKVSIGIGGAASGRKRDFDEQVDYVVEAEKLGVDAVWTAEAWGQDAISPLAYLGAKTSRIKLGTGIMQISARAPAMTAMTALTMAAITNDRFILGLGASGPQVVEGLHGRPFKAPLTRMKETDRHHQTRVRRREDRIPRPVSRTAAAGRAGQGAAAVATRQRQHSDLSRDARSCDARIHRRRGGRLARYVVHAGTRGRPPRLSAARRAKRRTHSRRHRHPGRRHGRVRRRHRRARRAAEARHGIHARRDGLGDDELLQRRVQARWLGRSRSRSAASVGLRANAKRRSRRCRPRW